MVGLQRASFFMAVFVLPIIFGVLLIFFSPQASARLGLLKVETFIVVDGVNFGEIHGISSLGDLTGETQKRGENFTRVTIKRDFVTERSLFQLAHDNAQNRSRIHKISLTTQTSNGAKIARYELNNCKPLSWTVTADPSQGGFHEKIDLAVQEIIVY